jgi:hypothetical protein
MMRYSSSIIMVFLALVAGLLLFYSAQAVYSLDRHVQSIQISLQEEKESIRLLKIEWDYLNRPERLEQLAAHYFPDYTHGQDYVMASVEDLPDHLDPEDLPVDNNLLAKDTNSQNIPAVKQDIQATAPQTTPSEQGVILATMKVGGHE